MTAVAEAPPAARQRSLPLDLFPELIGGRKPTQKVMKLKALAYETDREVRKGDRLTLRVDVRVEEVGFKDVWKHDKALGDLIFDHTERVQVCRILGAEIQSRLRRQDPDPDEDDGEDNEGDEAGAE